MFATRAGTLRLRTLTLEDAPEFARHAAADREHLREHLSWGETTHELDGALAWLGRYHEGADGRVLVAGAFDGDTLVGGALLMGHEPAAAAVEVGCWATAGVVGQGVAGAASAALIAHARGVLAAERVVWRCTTVNPPLARARRAPRLPVRGDAAQRARPARGALRPGPPVARRRGARPVRGRLTR